ncbi:MAG: FAD-dependent oxidoreductase [Pseudorhodoplanes sp.]
MTADMRAAFQTLATEAVRRGRLTLGRSFRFHRRRGAFCHSGWCQQCKVRLADGKTVLACKSPPAEMAQNLIGKGLLRPIGLLAEGFPPWFHEKRLLRPRFLRQFYLSVLRGLSAALPLPLAPSGVKPKKWQEFSTDVLVVGGGLAGMKAALLLARSGKTVTLVEAETLGHHARAHAELDRIAADLQAELERSNVRVMTKTTCVGLYENVTRAFCVSPAELSLVGFRQLVVATGAYDRLLTFRGNDKPGIVGLRGFERLLAADAIAPGLRVGLFVAVDHLPRALAALAAAGIKPAWIASPGAIAAQNCRTLPDVRIRSANGMRKLKAVTFSNGESLGCDLLVLGFSQPSYELQLQAGRRIALDGEAGIIRTQGQSAMPLTVVGEAAGALTPKDALDHAEHAIGAAGMAEPVVSFATDNPVCPDDRAFLCPCEDVRVSDVKAAITDGFDDIELIKRRTGAGTGPCQGKLCHPALARCLSDAGLDLRLPTMRPLLRPMALAEFRSEENG